MLGPRTREFMLTGLTSRGGLSNWVAFFFEHEAVFVDLGIRPAVLAGVRTGLAAGLESAGVYTFGTEHYGPEAGALSPVVFCEALSREAQRIFRVADGELEEVLLELRLTAHRLTVMSPSGRLTFGLMNRHEAEAVRPHLEAHLGARFRVESSAPFAFLAKHAPLLTK
jgi:hypothetical protein